MRIRRLGGGGGGGGRYDTSDLDREFGYFVLALLGIPLLVIGGFFIYITCIYTPPPTVEKTAVVTSVEIKRSSGSGNGKSKDKLYVWFDNGLYYYRSFNRRDGDPAEAKSFKVGDRYKLWHREDWKCISQYQKVE